MDYRLDPGFGRKGKKKEGKGGGGKEQKAQTILPKCALSWAQDMWHERHSLSVDIWFQDWAYLSPDLTIRVLSHPHRLIYNYFSISVKYFPPQRPLIFFVSTICQSIWPSPGFPQQKESVRKEWRDSSSSSSSLLSTFKIATRQKSRGVDSDRTNLD